ncbi:hypothetical protein NDU88_009829 [Pleurodeles waltl]|uniref:Uncharacterized protein n=1 Tax=Pleurodeles waltl TaxID=8319 RepID=A0AAV7S0U2_PLEWA|nr:hypothetical protein NDU88_009829 [Pleurodeles waltl]
MAGGGSAVARSRVMAGGRTCIYSPLGLSDSEQTSALLITPPFTSKRLQRCETCKRGRESPSVDFTSRQIRNSPQ